MKILAMQRRWAATAALFVQLDFLPLLSLRLFLAPVFIAAGLTKATAFGDTVNWFGNPDFGLGLPVPALMAFLATAAELLGGFLLLIGLATRLVSLPLIVTMLVAIFAVHWDHGWFAIAPSNPSTSMAAPLAKLGFPGAAESLENSEEVGKRLSAAKRILREHGNYAWLTGRGGFVVLNNGIEFAATYLAMLLVLLVFGPGRFVSVDYWIGRVAGRGSAAPPAGV